MKKIQLDACQSENALEVVDIAEDGSYCEHKISQEESENENREPNPKRNQQTFQGFQNMKKDKYNEEEEIPSSQLAPYKFMEIQIQTFNDTNLMEIENQQSQEQKQESEQEKQKQNQDQEKEEKKEEKKEEEKEEEKKEEKEEQNQVKELERIEEKREEGKEEVEEQKQEKEQEKVDEEKVEDKEEKVEEKEEEKGQKQFQEQEQEQDTKESQEKLFETQAPYNDDDSIQSFQSSQICQSPKEISSEESQRPFTQAKTLSPKLHIQPFEPGGKVYVCESPTDEQDQNSSSPQSIELFSKR